MTFYDIIKLLCIVQNRSMFKCLRMPVTMVSSVNKVNLIDFTDKNMTQIQIVFYMAGVNV